MLTKNNNKILISNENFKKNRKQISSNENIIDHGDCIVQMDMLYQKMEKMENDYKEMYKEKEMFKSKFTELLEWKKNHKCSDDVNMKCIKEDIIKGLNIKETPDYIELNKIKESYNEKIKKLESDIDNIQLNSNIEDNNLFKQLKHQNTILLKSNEKLESNYNTLNKEFIKLKNDTNNINIDNNIDKQSIINEIKISLETKFSLEKDEIKNKYEKRINDLEEKLNNKINKVKLNKADKNFMDSIKIYKEIDNKSKEYISSYTYRQINDYNILRKLVIEEYNEENYDNIINYMIKYIGNKKSKWYFIKKIKRCLYLCDTYDSKLKIFNFSISFISGLSEEDWNIWIKLLDNIINENSNELLNLNSKNEIITENIKCTNEQCNNFYENHEEYCDICNFNTKVCENCGDEFITDKKHINECGEC